MAIKKKLAGGGLPTGIPEPKNKKILVEKCGGKSKKKK